MNFQFTLQQREIAPQCGIVTHHGQNQVKHFWISSFFAVFYSVLKKANVNVYFFIKLIECSQPGL